MKQSHRAGDSPKDNKRTWWNNRTGQKILQKVHERTGWNNCTPVNNSSQNIENLVYFETVLKILLDDNFFFSRIIEKNTLKLQKLINAKYQIRTHRQDFFLKKNKWTCSLVCLIVKSTGSDLLNVLHVNYVHRS